MSEGDLWKEEGLYFVGQEDDLRFLTSYGGSYYKQLNGLCVFAERPNDSTVSPEEWWLEVDLNAEQEEELMMWLVARSEKRKQMKESGRWGR